jgi:NADH-quinone oxidoreductase subunit H
MTFGYSVDALATWISGSPDPAGWAVAVAVLAVWVGPLMGVIFLVAALGQIIERKIAAAMQRRHGPNSVGIEGILVLAVRLGAFFLPRVRQDALIGAIARLPGVAWTLAMVRRLGLGQLAADGVKMLGKEDVVPAGADGLVFRCAPYLALVGAFLPFVVVPFSNQLVMAELSVGAVYLGAVGGLVVIALLMAGWGSGNKWSLLGGMRAVAQVVSYEIPVGLCIAAVVLWCGTMDLHAIVAAQYNGSMLSFTGWNLLQSPFMVLLAAIFFLAALAECQRTPFDMAESESELVSGFNTEYSGLRWGMFAMAEYTEMILVGCLFATFFLGGYQSPVGEPWIVAQPAWIEVPVHFAILLAKFTAVLVAMVWIRWTLPRFRVDQVMRLCWLKLVPLALIGMAGLAATMLLTGQQVVTGPAYGRLPGQPQLAVSPLGHALAWLLPLAAIVLLVWLARRKYGQVHPALRRLMGAA